MKRDKNNIDINAVEDHDGILTIRGGGARRDWNGIHYKQGMSAKNVGTTVAAIVAPCAPGATVMQFDALRRATYREARIDPRRRGP